MQLPEVDKDGKHIVDDSATNIDNVAAGKVEPAYVPEQLDEKYRTTKAEIISYYCYYIGNNGLSLFSQ